MLVNPGFTREHKSNTGSEDPAVGAGLRAAPELRNLLPRVRTPHLSENDRDDRGILRKSPPPIALAYGVALTVFIIDMFEVVYPSLR